VSQYTDYARHGLRFIHGVPSQLVVHGDNAGPAGVTWLNEGIKALAIPVILPAAANLQIINAISIYQLSLFFTQATAYNPAFSTDNTVANFQLPFAFPLNIVQAATSITTVNGNTPFALLDVPLLPTTTDVVPRILHLTFSNIPFAVFADQHQTFSQFLTDTTDDAAKTFGLTGQANSE
jgi:hypothetical protein